MMINLVVAKSLRIYPPLAANENGGVDVMVRTSAIYREQLAKLLKEGKSHADADWLAYDIALTVIASRERFQREFERRLERGDNSPGAA
jgi:hypothetical protein